MFPFGPRIGEYDKPLTQNLAVLATSSTRSMTSTCVDCSETTPCLPTLLFPASNCDRDAATALEYVTGKPTAMLWHKDQDIPAGIDLIVLPGG